MEQKESIKHRLRTINQKFVVAILEALAHLPLRVLYVLADLLYYPVAYVFHYRRKVIDDNLRHSFPEKSVDELALLRKKYYRHFCDLAVETIKLSRISEAEIEKRYHYTNPEVFSEPLPSQKGMIVLAMHYSNWEWGIILPKHLEQTILMVYNQMRDNVPFDNFLEDSRKRWGGVAVVMSRAARVSMDYKRRNEPAMLWLAADQSAPHDAQFWMRFLNREAPFFAGPVKLAQKLNQPIYFQRVKKLSRGMYESDFTLLIEEPAKVEASVILGIYIQKMEEVIRETPEYYLWSHRRWKHKRPEGTELMV